MTIWNRTRLRTALVLVQAVAFVVPCGMSQAVTEDQVKAAYLLNFAKFVQWPEGSLGGADPALHICTLGRSAVADELDSVKAGQAIDGHPIDVRRLDSPEQAKNCHLVYLSVSANKQLGKILPVAKGHPTLLVGETESFTRSGGTIGFVTEKGRVLFAINVEAAAEAHLKISSRLLALARIVRTREERAGQ